MLHESSTKEEISKLKSKLRVGDQLAIADLTGLHRVHICQILNGKRSANTKGGQLILEAAQGIISSREHLANTLRKKN